MLSLSRLSSWCKWRLVQKSQPLSWPVIDLGYPQAVITELVFEHALRIRMKEDRSGSKKSSSAPVTPDSASAVTVTGQVDNAAESIAEDTDATPTPSEETTPAPTAKSEEEEDANSNLVGKINNLISSDLENITDLTELPMVVVYTPLKIGLSIWFLYVLLGWRYDAIKFNLFLSASLININPSYSTFVGIGLMFLGLIIPGK